MEFQIILLRNTLIKKELKACVQYFPFFHQVIALKIGFSPSKEICVIRCTELKAVKNDEKFFLFHLKSCFVLKIFMFLFMFKFLVM